VVIDFMARKKWTVNFIAEETGQLILLTEGS
jgi:hypothetical protein